MKHYIIFLSIFCFLLLNTACNFAPGSYPYAQEYEINSDELNLIKAVETFKKENTDYIVPKQTQLKDGRNDSKDHWYHMYFYFPQENQIIYCWTRPINNRKTTLAFVSVNSGLTLGNWKDINKDFNSAENEKEKEKFEETILKNIKSILATKK